MWFLTSDTDKRVVYFTSSNKEIVVGRSNDLSVCNFPILDDTSISRRHATITLNDDDLILQDLGSKYCTFLIDIKDGKRQLTDKDKIILKQSNVIQFGKLNSIWTVNKTDFITCSSTLKGENLQILKNNLEKLGGIFKNDWEDNCSYLTMPAITLTIKVVLALVQGAYIVTPEYWKICCEAVDSSTKLPDPKLFVPHIIETTLNMESLSFVPDPKRKTIFKDKKIVFFSRKQFEMYKAVVKNASGTPLLLSESKLTKSMLCSDEIIVVQYFISNITQETNTVNQINDIVNYLKSKGKRVVSDAEIGLAVLYGSLTKHCNPNFSVSSEVIRNTVEVCNKTSNILAKETQDLDSNMTKDNIVIEESLVSSNDTKHDERNILSNSNKRKLSGDENMDVSVKRFNVDKSYVNNDGNELFNFVNDELTSNSDERRLNLMKPQKRKVDYVSDEEDLFDFIPEKNESNTTLKSSNTFRKDNDVLDNNNTDVPTAKKPRLEESVSTPVRGIKAKELQDSDESCWKTCIKTEVKEEPEYDTNDLNDRIEKLDLGTSVIEIKTDLIKKEVQPFHSEVYSSTKNYKKFKKVWPINMQVFNRTTNSICEIEA